MEKPEDYPKIQVSAFGQEMEENNSNISDSESPRLMLLAQLIVKT